VAGYASKGRKLALNPVGHKDIGATIFHEIAHIVLGHTEDDSPYAGVHRGVKEFQAEAVAYLLANELLTDKQWSPSESRAYVQGWLKGTNADQVVLGDDGEVKETHVRAIFGAVNKILKAGRPQKVSQDAK
jgi:hypothetical protein